MISWLLILTPLLPLVLAASLFGPRGVRAVLGPPGAWAGPVAAVPGLVLSLSWLPVPDLRIPWLFLGAQFGIDPISRVFLLLTSVLWLLAAVFARPYMATDPRRTRYDAFFLLTMSGNLGLVVAQDVATFYAAFAVMTFAAYGMVVHSGSREAIRAGRVYIVLALVGEALLLAGFLLAAAAGGLRLDGLPAAVVDGVYRDTASVLLLAGFGVKVGAAFLHVWLPLAHPIAPTPASAVLSGAIIKAGVLGWMRFLPLGEAALPEAGGVAIAAGLIAAYGAVAVGVTQRDAKAALAYSSVSQMGLVTIAVGVALANPDSWPLARAAVLVSVLHHAMAKGALFLGAGVAGYTGRWPWSPWLLMVGLGVPMLSLAGAPWSGGVLSKEMLKQVTVMAPGGWSPVLEVGMPLAAVGTTVLMAHFARLVWGSVRRPSGRAEEISHRADAAARSGVWTPWLASVLATGLVTPVAAGLLDLTAAAFGQARWGEMWPALWPIGVGMTLAVLLERLDAGSRRIPELPAGDVLTVYLLIGARLSTTAVSLLEAARRLPAALIRARWEPRWPVRGVFGWVLRPEAPASLAGAGTAWLLLAAGLLAALWIGGGYGR
jgi:formate hydrogenlyase subunit 3/multisubunit Na+/H+ antiporter MnhD subunit